jgi:hypothetical protein
VATAALTSAAVWVETIVTAHDRAALRMLATARPAASCEQLEDAAPAREAIAISFAPSRPSAWRMPGQSHFARQNSANSVRR